VEKFLNSGDNKIMSTSPQTFQNVSETIIQRLVKLNALKERAGSESEAANAADKIARILEKYNLEEGVIERHQRKQSTGIEGKPEYTTSSIVQVYDSWMAHTVCKMVDVKFFVRYHFKQVYVPRTRSYKKVKTNSYVVFCGLPNNVAVAMHLFKMFVDTLLFTMDKRYHDGSLRGAAAHQSYRLGFADSLVRLCEELKNARMKEHYNENQIEGDTCQALVRVGQEVAQKYFDDMFKDAPKEEKKAKEVHVKDIHSFRLGVRDGKQVDVTSLMENHRG
jgi:hypothetical protein